MNPLKCISIYTLFILSLASLTLASFAQANKDFWEQTNGVGSKIYWEQNTGVGSKIYWEQNTGAGSKYYWEHGQNEGSKFYWENGTGEGSKVYWNQYTGKGSKYFWEHIYDAMPEEMIGFLHEIPGILNTPKTAPKQALHYSELDHALAQLGNKSENARAPKVDDGVTAQKPSIGTTLESNQFGASKISKPVETVPAK